MKRLTCEMCGSTDLIKEDGVFVCQTCGCKYSVEEAKKLMVEVTGNVTVTNPVIVQGVARADTILENALNLLEYGNYADALKQLSEVLTMDPQNIRAKVYRGLATTWVCATSANQVLDVGGSQSVNEALSTMGDAVSKAEAKIGFDELQTMLVNVMKIHCKELSRLITLKKMGGAVNLNCTVCCVKINGIVNGVIDDSKNFTDDFCNQFMTFVEQYLEYSAVSGLKYPGFEDDECAGYAIMKRYIAKKQEAEAKKRYDEYWQEHAEEKKQYEARLSEIDIEIKKLSRQLDQYDSRIAEIKKDLSQKLPAENQLAELKKQQNDLMAQKSKLGLFAGKQKKALQAQIDSLQTQIDGVDATVKRLKKEIQDDVNARVSAVEAEWKPISDKISALEGKKSKINFELNKDR